jgi:phage gpG-like protein
MNFHSKITGDREVIARLGAMPERVHRALLNKIGQLNLKLLEKVQGKLRGRVLNYRKGRLFRSIFQKIEQTPTSVIGKVASSGDVRYAAIHEFGGTTKAHDILPVKALALAFMTGKGGPAGRDASGRFKSSGTQVFAKVVHHPGSKMPERSYLRSSLAEMREEIVGGIKQAALAAAGAR